MKTFAERFESFLNHLEQCGGCLGKRNSNNCEYSFECLVVEVFARRGLVANGEELLAFGYKKNVEHSTCDD